MPVSVIKKGSMLACVTAGLVGILASMIPDAAIHGQLTWSWIVTAAVVYGIGVVLPLIWSLQKGWVVSLLWLSAELLPFLVCIEWVCNEYILPSPVHWMSSLGLPLTILWLTIVWIVVLVGWRFRRFWYTVSLACLLGGAGSFITNMLARHQTFSDIWWDVDILLNTGAAILSAFVCLMIGIYRRSSR